MPRRPTNKQLKMRRGLRKKILEAVDEYVEEAEHQDGFAYWNQFEGIDEVVDDFVLFLFYAHFDEDDI